MQIIPLSPSFHRGKRLPVKQRTHSMDEGHEPQRSKRRPRYPQASMTCSDALVEPRGLWLGRRYKDAFYGMLAFVIDPQDLDLTLSPHVMKPCQAKLSPMSSLARLSKITLETGTNLFFSNKKTSSNGKSNQYTISWIAAYKINQIHWQTPWSVWPFSVGFRAQTSRSSYDTPTRLLPRHLPRTAISFPFLSLGI